MATVKGPLFSIGASGTLGGAIVFSTWKGRPYVRQHAVPANPQSAGQLSIRAMLRFLSQYWDSLTDVQKADWETRAAPDNISPFNAYVQYNLRRWGTNLNPSKLDPATNDGTPGTISAFSATASSRSILLSATISSHDDNWGIKIYRGDDTGMGVTRNELVYVLPAEDTATFTWLDFPLTAGVAVYYRCTPVDDTGVDGTVGSEVVATPTA